jgi:hypothetical protein
MTDWFLSGSRNELMTQAAMMTDYEIDKDFDDCLLPVAKSVEDAEVLAAYAKARRLAPYFGPGKRGSNNHDQVAALRQGTNRKCEGCGNDFRASRSTARFCSGKCRQRLARVA